MYIIFFFSSEIRRSSLPSSDFLGVFIYIYVDTYYGCRRARARGTPGADDVRDKNRGVEVTRGIFSLGTEGRKQNEVREDEKRKKTRYCL